MRISVKNFCRVFASSICCASAPNASIRLAVILGVIRQQTGDVESALTEFRRTIYIDPDFVMAHFAIANVLRQQGKSAEACRSYENTLRALNAKPEGAWTAFLGGFRPDMLARTCERSLIECSKGAREV